MVMASTKADKKSIMEFCPIMGTSKCARCLRIIWILLVIASAALCMYQLANLVNFYFAYPTSTVIRRENRHVPFPDVTVCNLQPLSSVNSSKTLEALEKYNSEVDDAAAHIRSRHTNTFSKFLHSRNDSTPENLEQTIQGYLKTMKGMAQNMNLAKFQGIGHKKESLIPLCSWTFQNSRVGSNTACDLQAEVQKHFDPNYIKCYTVQAANASNNMENSVESLKLILYLDQFVKMLYADYDAERDQRIGMGVLVALHVPAPCPTSRTPSQWHQVHPLPSHWIHWFISNCLLRTETIGLLTLDTNKFLKPTSPSIISHAIWTAYKTKSSRTADAWTFCCQPQHRISENTRTVDKSWDMRAILTKVLLKPD